MEGMEEDQPAYISEGHPRNRYIRRTKFGRSLSLAIEAPPFRHPHDLNFILVFFPISFLISVIPNKQTKIQISHTRGLSSVARKL